jgi:hypothetical protein
MGLDTSHDAWHGAYSAFGRWRNRLTEVAGYQLMSVNYDDGIKRDTPMIEWHLYRERIELMGEWAETPHDPLLVLIAHSDCEGVIHPAQAGPLADRLEGLLPLLGEEDGGGHIGGYREKTQKFIDGLRRAVAANEDVDFH